jgi:hypothetical protein
MKKMITIDFVIGTYQSFVLSPGRTTTRTSATGHVNVISVEGRRMGHDALGLGLGLLNLEEGYESEGECDWARGQR